MKNGMLLCAFTEEFDSCMFVPEGRWRPTTKKGKGQHKLWGKERREMRSEYKKERRGSYPSQARVYPNL